MFSYKKENYFVLDFVDDGEETSWVSHNEVYLGGDILSFSVVGGAKSRGRINLTE